MAAVAMGILCGFAWGQQPAAPTGDVAATTTATAATTATTNNAPSPPVAPPPPTSEMRDKLTLFTGKSIPGNITDCRNGEVMVNVTASIGTEDQRTIAVFAHRHKCSDIESIIFGVPDASLEKKIVKEALLVGNGVLAYNIAGLLNNDPSMKFISEDPDLGQAATNIQTARSVYYALAKKVDDAEARAAYFDRHILSTTAPAFSKSALDAACDAIIEEARLNGLQGGQEAADTFRAWQALMRSERDSLRPQLPAMTQQRDAANAIFEKAKAAMATICKDIFKRAFSARQTGDAK
jgi:hypothetical protein